MPLFFAAFYHFNPRARVGRDYGISRQGRSVLISIHAPAWGATIFCLHFVCKSCDFNPRARVGRDKARSEHYAAFAISIHAPAWGATCSNTSKHPEEKISIHAPAWGATQFLEEADKTRRISIHAPAWGATMQRMCKAGWMNYFNPRARVGRDWISPCCRRRYPYFNPRARVGRDAHAASDGHTEPISIHAPAWGATMNRLFLVAQFLFQSTRPRGARRAQRGLHSRRRLFQSTRPRGARQLRHGLWLGRSHFNPRARVGRDAVPESIATLMTRISIHAPAWGATTDDEVYYKEWRDFNPRARVGRDTSTARA